MDENNTNVKRYILRRIADARGGDSQPRTAAAPAAAPKLDRRTFLDNPPQSNSLSTAPPQGVTYTIKVHDFGRQWVEASWGQSISRPGRRGHKGTSTNKELNEARAQSRAVGEIRRKCIAIGADHLLTLTYRRNVQDRARVLRDLEQFRRMLARAGKPVSYVCVLECQKRGAIHPHFGVRGFQDVRLMRRCWYKIVGKGQGQVNVEGPPRNGSPVKLARYLSKYVTKAFGALPREFGEHRYFCSLGINPPTERYQLVISPQAEEVPRKLMRLLYLEMVRRIGDHCSIADWTGSGGTYGWISGYQDQFCRWFIGNLQSLKYCQDGMGLLRDDFW